MADPFAGYDSWLEAPYQQMCAESDAFYDFCEANDIDPEKDGAEQAYQDWLSEQYEEPDFDDAYDDFEDYDESGFYYE